MFALVELDRIDSIYSTRFSSSGQLRSDIILGCGAAGLRRIQGDINLGEARWREHLVILPLEC
jgi:hypothetical protein